MSEAAVAKQPESPLVAKTEGESAFELAWRRSQALAASDIVPDAYKAKPANCMIALEVAQRLGSSPFLIMQNSHIIHGKLGWSSSFIIGAINASKKFSPLRFTMSGEGESRECFAWAKDIHDGEVIEGPAVSMAMAKAEGWLGKSGSKWKTMPELMLRYRAAAFFGRLYAPEIMLGLHTTDEYEDISMHYEPEEPQSASALNKLRDVTPERRCGRCGHSYEDHVHPSLGLGDCQSLTCPCARYLDVAPAPPSNPALETEPPADYEGGG